MMAFWGIVAAQLLLLLWLTGIKEYTLYAGTAVVLQTVPVDPRSLLQGDYAVLRYQISTIPGHLDYLSRGDTVYVSLRERGEVWEAESYGTQRPSDARVFIKGAVGDNRLLDFGIGAYFLPEGSGYIIEQARDVKVKVSINGSGNAVIKGLMVDGRPFNPAQPGPSPTPNTPERTTVPAPPN
jgi:uncharacterized membrane-anchored protein